MIFKLLMYKMVLTVCTQLLSRTSTYEIFMLKYRKYVPLTIYFSANFQTLYTKISLVSDILSYDFRLYNKTSRHMALLITNLLPLKINNDDEEKSILLY